MDLYVRFDRTQRMMRFFLICNNNKTPHMGKGLCSAVGHIFAAIIIIIT